MKAGYLVKESRHRSTALVGATRLSARSPLAFCTLALVATLGVSVCATAAFATPENVARHIDRQLRAGAVSLPLDAEIEYTYALAAIGKGDLAKAKEHLESSIALAPHFTDSYFTLARIEARRLSPDAIFWFAQGVIVSTRSFEAQSLFAANTALALTFVFLIASTIFWLTMALRYFPFIVHRMAEWLVKKFNAATARLCAYLLLLTPFVLYPKYAVAIGLVLLLTWPFMQKRERVMSFLSAVTFAALAWCSPLIDRYSTIADPSSLTSLIAQANESAADRTLAGLIDATPSRGLEAEQQTAMGLLAMRAGQQEEAVGHFLRAIERDPDASIAYVNLGNNYFLNGRFDKALEGYRKAEQVNAGDAVGQYNLAQAYIKTLLMEESSQALKRAAQAGFDPIRDSFAQRARSTWSIYPRIYDSNEFWRMASVEGNRENAAVFSSALASATGLPARTGALIVAAALLLSLAGVRVIKRHRLAFQCSNCGELTCNSCCSDEHNTILCKACGKSVTGVTSDRVLDALLRQRRQQLIVKRRKSIKWVTVWLPGVRHFYYGRVISGAVLTSFFAGCVVSLLARGYILPRWASFDYTTPLWQIALPAFGIVLSYTIAIFARQLYEVRTRANISRSPRQLDPADVDAASSL